jgi:hypothetical protein
MGEIRKAFDIKDLSHINPLVKLLRELHLPDCPGHLHDQLVSSVYFRSDKPSDRGRLGVMAGSNSRHTVGTGTILLQWNI